MKRNMHGLLLLLFPFIWLKVFVYLACRKLRRGERGQDLCLAHSFGGRLTHSTLVLGVLSLLSVLSVLCFLWGEQLRAEVLSSGQYRDLIQRSILNLRRAERLLSSQSAQRRKEGILQTYKVADQLESVSLVRTADRLFFPVDNKTVAQALRRAASRHTERSKTVEELRRVVSQLEATLALQPPHRPAQMPNADHARQTLKQVLSSGEFRDPWKWLWKLWDRFWRWLSRPGTPLLRFFQAIGKALRWVFTPIIKALSWLGTQILNVLKALAALPVEVLVVTAVGAFLILFGLIIYWLLPRMMEHKTLEKKATQVPPLWRRNIRQLLLEAERLAEEGLFTDALRRVYLATLLTLDQEGLLRFRESKTNWEYVREVAPNGRGRGRRREEEEMAQRWAMSSEEQSQLEGREEEGTAYETTENNESKRIARRSLIAQLLTQVTDLFERCVYARIGATGDDYQRASQAYQQLRAHLQSRV